MEIMLIDILNDERVIYLTLWFIGILLACIGILSGVIFKLGKWAFGKWEHQQPVNAQLNKDNFQLVADSISEAMNGIKRDIREIKGDVHEIKSEVQGHKLEIYAIKEHLKIEK